MKISVALTCFVLLMSSCIATKEGRVLKKTTKDWRESPLVLSGYLDTPFSGVFLYLRENGKFEHTSSGMLRGFSAGTWTFQNDTIRLNYLDSKKNVTAIKTVLKDTITRQLIFLEDSAAFHMRYTIHSGQWK